MPARLRLGTYDRLRSVKIRRDRRVIDAATTPDDCGERAFLPSTL